MEDCFFDIHCVLVTQVNDQKIQWQLTAGVFFSYKSAVVNYRWRYFSFLLVFLRSIESQKNNLQNYDRSNDHSNAGCCSFDDELACK